MVIRSIRMVALPLHVNQSQEIIPNICTESNLLRWFPTWPNEQFAAAIRTNGVHPLSAVLAKGAFIAANVSPAVLNERFFTLLTFVPHFQCHCSTSVDP